jgi:phosphatidylserine/phosphatidylglycerophosphate/cardiolipin synthase-like enzyme
VDVITLIGTAITLLSAIITVISAVETRRALALAEDQNRQAVAQTDELKQLTGKQNVVTDEISNITSEMTRIEKSLSTRHIGTIKDYLPVVVREIQSAEKSISILCDFPAYGYFMDHSSYQEYRLAILSKIDKGVKVSLMCLNEACRADSNRKVLSITDDNWDVCKRSQKNHDVLHKLGYSSEHFNDLRLEDFLNDLEAVDRKILNGFFSGATIETVNTLLPFDFWLIDDSRAIFAFSPYSGDASQHGFLTLDEKLVAGFEYIKDRYRHFNNC